MSRTLLRLALPFAALPLCSAGQGSIASFCTTSPNSVGPGAHLQWVGQPNVQFGAMTVDGLPPNVFGTFLYSSAQINPTPFGSGVTCVGVPTWNMARRTSDAQGKITLRVWNGAENEDLHWLTYPGNIGVTWFIQLAYRDVGPTGPTVNVSDGVAVEFGAF